MSGAYRIRTTGEQRQAISKLVSGYWGNDVWDVRDAFFDDIRPVKWHLRIVDFSAFSPSIRDEVKYLYASCLQKKKFYFVLC